MSMGACVVAGVYPWLPWLPIIICQLEVLYLGHVVVMSDQVLPCKDASCGCHVFANRSSASL